MATYADLKARIISETNRDDLVDTLAGQLTTHIAQAIDFYASRRFWFTEGVKTSATVAGNEYLAKPTGMRVIDRLTVLVGAVAYSMLERPFNVIDELATVTSIGQPTSYAELVDQIRMWPKPGIVYPMTFIGIVDQTALVNPTDSNAWTNQAYDLITARTKFTLYRGQFKDDTGANYAKDEEAEALNRLVGETANRLSTGNRAYG